jgi:pyridoxamine 5'-phosphate oxidase
MPPIAKVEFNAHLPSPGANHLKHRPHLEDKIMHIDAGTDPYTLFQTWYDEAVASEINDPDAMAIASVDESGMPSVRMVLLKEWGVDGFAFYTNYESRKSAELLTTGKAAFCIHWKSLRRQVRVTGPVSQVDGARSDTYFATRGRGSRIGAWASAQSRPLDSRASLAAAVADIEARFPDDVPRPPHWGGFLIAPQEIEFWADGEHRLHDRFRFTRDDKDGWDIQRLNP